MIDGFHFKFKMQQFLNSSFMNILSCSVRTIMVDVCETVIDRYAYEYER